jgi:hypothetical protein
MGGMDNLNWDQHRLTERSVHGLNMPRDHREILARAVSGGHPIIARQGKDHVKLYIKDNGIVVASGSGGRGRGSQNFESQLRRGHRQANTDFPRKNESLKQFQQRMLNEQNEKRMLNEQNENQEGTEFE